MDISALLFTFPLLMLNFSFFCYDNARTLLCSSSPGPLQEAISGAGLKAFVTHCQTLPRNVPSVPAGGTSVSPLHWQGRLGPPFLGRGTTGSVLAAPVFPHPCVPVAITLRIAASSPWLFSLRSLIASSVPEVPGIFLNILPPTPSEMAVLKLGSAGGRSGCGTQCDSDFSAVPLFLSGCASLLAILASSPGRSGPCRFSCT